MQARFVSPDGTLDGVSLVLPQSWNGYNYALNNPLAFIDKDGAAPFLASSLPSNVGLLWRDPVFLGALWRSVNSSPRDFLEGGSWDRKFVGIMGEAVVADALGRDLKVSAIIQPNFDDDSGYGAHPDILVRDTNRKMAVGTMRLVSDASDAFGHAGEIDGSLGFYAEVKVLSPDNENLFKLLLKGADQARKVAGGLYGSLLVVDTKTWAKLTEDKRSEILGNLGPAQLAVIDGLNSQAVQRLNRLRMRLRMAAEDPYAAEKR